MRFLFDGRDVARTLCRASLLLSVVALPAWGQKCASATPRAQRYIDRFLASPGDSAFRAVHGITARSSQTLEPLREGPDSRLCARMNASFPRGFPAAYFRDRGVIIGTDVQEPAPGDRGIHIREVQRVLVFNSHGRFLYLPGQTPSRLPKAAQRFGARAAENEQAKSSAELAIANWVRQGVSGPIIFEPRIHQRGRWVVRRAPQNSSAIASAMGANLGTAKAALACQPNAVNSPGSSCPLAGGGTVVAFTRPVIRGDTANAVLVRWTRSGNVGSSPAQQASNITLVRSGSGWQILRSTPRKQVTG